jgi:HKD family nuclease
MRISIVNQYLEQATTGARLSTLLNNFSGQPNAQFRVLVGFASRAGFQLFERPLRHFLDCGHSTFWIVGVDLGGTGREALEFLYSLSREYPGQVDARILTVGDNAVVFHPKVYWLDSQVQRMVLIGSANATAGGLGQNFEVSAEIEVEPEANDELGEQLDHLWISYSSPLPPLTPAHVLPVDLRLIGRLGPDLPPTDARPALPHPLRGLVPRVRLHRPARSGARARIGTGTGHRWLPNAGRELIMDILHETRGTQVQIPVEAFGTFFDMRRSSITLRQRIAGAVVKEDRRPFIHLANKTHRIEIDAIRGLPRPQIIRMWRDRHLPGVVDYQVVLRGTRGYAELDRLLETEGERTRQGARRWLARETGPGNV